MATQTTDQQNALKDAMARAKQIAAKLQQQQSAGLDVTAQNDSFDEMRKRNFTDTNTYSAEPVMKRPALDGAVDHTDPKVIAQQVANSLVQRAGLGSMLVEEVFVPNKLVGLVIGRGGEMINKLQSESGAKIQVAADPSPEQAAYHTERQITITGTSDCVNKAKELIEQIRQDGKVPEKLLIGPTAPGEYATEMMIQTGKVGLVIGKGGETIKNLQERAGCKMVLFQEGEYAHAQEKPLRLSGEYSKVMYGKQIVQDLLTAKELESMNPDKQNQQFNQGGAYEEVQVPKEAVGFVIGTKGSSINQLQAVTGCRVQFKRDEPSGGSDHKIATLTGTPQQVADAKQKLLETINTHLQRKGQPPMGGGPGPMPNRNFQNFQGGPGGPRPGWGGGPGGPPFNGPGGPRPGWGGHNGPRGWGPRGPPFNSGPSLPPGHKHMEIHVPAAKCGLVIGKGGETLKHIHHESKVNIDINREIPTDLPFRVFHVRGTDEQINSACQMIRDKIGDQSISPRPPQNEGPQGPPGPQGPMNNQWGGPPNNQWGGPPNQQWGPQGPNQWPQPQQNWGQGGQDWGQQNQQWNQQQGQQAQPNQAQQPGGQPQPTWNPTTQTWEQPQQWNQQQPQQPGAQQWNSQYQWGQQAYQQPAASTAAASTPQATPTSTTTSDSAPTTTASGQPDYSAAWALYYQQQNQYYQQYAMQQQQQGAGATSTTNTTATSSAASTTTPTSDPSQSQAMADYQARMAEYYKSLGQQPPQ